MHGAHPGGAADAVQRAHRNPCDDAVDDRDASDDAAVGVPDRRGRRLSAAGRAGHHDADLSGRSLRGRHDRRKPRKGGDQGGAEASVHRSSSEHRLRRVPDARAPPVSRSLVASAGSPAGAMVWKPAGPGAGEVRGSLRRASSFRSAGAVPPRGSTTRRANLPCGLQAGARSLIADAAPEGRPITASYARTDANPRSRTPGRARSPPAERAAPRRAGSRDGAPGAVAAAGRPRGERRTAEPQAAGAERPRRIRVRMGRGGSAAPAPDRRDARARGAPTRRPRVLRRRPDVRRRRARRD